MQPPKTRANVGKSARVQRAQVLPLMRQTLTPCLLRAVSLRPTWLTKPT